MRIEMIQYDKYHILIKRSVLACMNSGSDVQLIGSNIMEKSRNYNTYMEYLV